MKNLKILLGLIFLSAASIGCSSSGTTASIYEPQSPYAERKSREWCQDNYSSASVGSRERQSNAKYCDEQSRRAYLEAQRKQRSSS